MMKTLWIIGLGIAIWSLGLFWPGMNRITLAWPVYIGTILGVGGLIFPLVLDKLLRKQHKPKGAGHDHPTRPMPVTR